MFLRAPLWIIVSIAAVSSCAAEPAGEAFGAAVTTTTIAPVALPVDVMSASTGPPLPGVPTLPRSGEPTAPRTTRQATASPVTTSPLTTSPVTTSTVTTSETPPSPVTTSPVIGLSIDVYDKGCVVVVQVGDSLQLIADRFDDEVVSGASVRAENGLPDEAITPGQVLDVCVDNGIDDITGESIGRNGALLARDVQRQQTKLNALFARLGMRELDVDGVAGPVTRQRLCAARLALGLPPSTDEMAPGSDEEQALMVATSIGVPLTTAALSDRWVLIDRTCQVMFVGRGADRLDFVFPTSTGQPGFETRLQNRSAVFKFNPELDNGGWHNSLTYPAAEDNPLNGNMYKPLYFDRGQAIHGANSVPTSPASHGCARLRVEHHDLLIAWLGLGDSGPTTDAGQIALTVNVQGEWIAR